MKENNEILKANIGMKVLILNGSPKANGNTAIALAEMEKVFTENGIETEVILTKIFLV